MSLCFFIRYFVEIDKKSMADRANIDAVVNYIRNVNAEQFENIIDEMFEEIDFNVDENSNDSGYVSDFNEHAF